MTDNMKRFLEVVSEDKEFCAKLSRTSDTESAIELAKERGITLTEEDVKPAEKIQEVPDDELEAVAGGKACYCAVGGGGEKTEDNEEVCACVLYGTGNKHFKNDVIERCACWYAGYGDN